MYILVKTFEDLHRASVNTVVPSPDGRFVASGGGDGRVNVIELIPHRRGFKHPTARFVCCFDPPSDLLGGLTEISSIAWGYNAGPGSQLLLFVSFFHGQIFLYEGPPTTPETKFAAFLLRFLGKPTSLECFEIAHFREEVRRLVYDEGQRRLIIGATSGAFIVRRNTRKDWRSSPRVPNFEIPVKWPVIGDTYTTSDVHILPRTNNFLITDINYGIHCMELQDGTAIGHYDILDGQRIGHSALSPDGTRLATWNLAGSLNIYDLKLQQLVKRIPITGIADPMYNKEIEVAWINGGNGVLVGSNFGVAAVIDIGSGTAVQFLEHSAVPRNVHIHAVAYASLGPSPTRFIITADMDRGAETQVKVWASKDENGPWFFSQELYLPVRKSLKTVAPILFLGVFGVVLSFGLPAALPIIYGTIQSSMQLAISYANSAGSTTADITVRIYTFIQPWLGISPPAKPQPSSRSLTTTLKNMTEFVYAFFFGVSVEKK